MKPRLLAQVFAVSAIALLSLTAVSQSSHSQQAPTAGQRRFYCDTSSGSPVTMYQTANGNREIWVRWESNTFSEVGYNPQRRCQEVSGRLESYRRNKQLRYITAGMMNRQRVICTASRVNGPCENLIYTLKPGQNPIATLNRLLAWREGQAGVGTYTESDSIPYIDLRERIEDDDASATQPSPVTPPSNGGNLREL